MKNNFHCRYCGSIVPHKSKGPHDCPLALERLADKYLERELAKVGGEIRAHEEARDAGKKEVQGDE